MIICIYDMKPDRGTRTVVIDVYNLTGTNKRTARINENLKVLL
jgi:hypothetical protein